MIKHRSATTNLLHTVATFAALGAPLLATAAAPASTPAYAVSALWTLDGAGKWDYADVDAQRHRLFIARGNRVQVLSLPSGKVAGEIAGTDGVHGVAFADDLKLGFTSNGKSNSVTVFDLDTLAVKQQIAISGGNPDAILYVPETRTLYTFNGKTANVSVIDATTLRETGTIAVSGRPEFAVSDHHGKIYLNIEDKGELAVIDTASRSMVAHWPLAGCEEPSGIALDGVHGRLFSVCQNKKMVVIDAATGARVAEVAIGAHPDAVVYDQASATVFTSNGDDGGSLSVIHQDSADRYSVRQALPTRQGAKTMAMDHASRTLYLPALKDGVFSVTVVAPK
jgi:YVTN family beta-propeller protein